MKKIVVAIIVFVLVVGVAIGATVLLKRKNDIVHGNVSGEVVDNNFADGENGGKDNKGENNGDESNKQNEISYLPFEERIKPYYEKLEEMSGDRFRKDFTKIKLVKEGDRYFLTADVMGDTKIEKKALEMSTNRLMQGDLGDIAVETNNGEMIRIFNLKPTVIQDMLDDAEEKYSKEMWYEDEGIPYYYDADWQLDDWNIWWMIGGIPIYVYYEGTFDEDWVRLVMEEDGFYLHGRSEERIRGDWFVSAINEKDAFKIELAPTDEIVIEAKQIPRGYYIEDYYIKLQKMQEEKEREKNKNKYPVVPTPEVEASGEIVEELGESLDKIVTVEEYYNLTLKNVNGYTDEDGFYIDPNNMCGANFHDEGLRFIDGKIHVVGRIDEPEYQY